ncbi:MAG: cellulase family glycosylhydrolase [Capnocytophaga sp.]|uniref:cellulase family glycosylhydrolase n=1 Tax=Capnocytophaga sp. TaxID=44737 RepID=UPI00280AA2A6|nr:cellulase family glycosylhydrolase [Capnocytophaga sp.]MDU6658621.1 cellulase family glycosylhydrolase [Capnocytophaga sp.]
MNITLHKTLRNALFLMLCLSSSLCLAQANITVSKTHPRYFEKNGATWIPISTNYLPIQNIEEAEKYFKHFAENGGNAMRIWISTEFLEIEDQREGKYNREKLARIEQLLQLAEKYHIYIKFTLHHLRTISNNISPEASWCNSRSLATKFKNVSEYVSSKKGKQSYLKRLKALAQKCQNHPYVYGWELWNEMDSAVPEAEWLPFTKEMLGKVKKLCPEQLVTQTLGSMHAPYMDDYYKKLAVIPDNEFLSIHRYLDEGDKWHQYPIVKGAVSALATDAVAMGLTFTKNDPKPVIINEIGAVNPNHAGPSSLYPKDAEGVLLHDFIFAPFFGGSAGSGNTWHWDHYIEPNQLWYHFGRFKNAIEGIDPVKEAMQPFYFKRNTVACYGLKGKTKTILWCRDPANNWKTELREGRPAQMKRDFEIPLNLINIKYTHYSVYDPWTDQWERHMPMYDGKALIPAFKRSIVVVLENP